MSTEPHRSEFVMVVTVGTEAAETVRKMHAIAAQHGQPLRHGVNVWSTASDTHFTPPRQSGDGEAALGTVDPLIGVFIENQFADLESRVRLWDTGELWHLSQHQCEHAGTREEGIGTGNTPAWGRADFRMNRQYHRKAGSEGMHACANERRKLRAATEGGQGGMDDALSCLVIVSSAGGEGSGAFLDICREIRSLASEHGIQVRIIAVLLDIGTLFPPNRLVTLRNRRWLLNSLRAVLTGQYRDPEGLNARSDAPLVDRLIISTNAGPSSELATLDEQEALTAKELYYLFFTPLGQRMREDIVDVDANRGKDDSGAPCAGSALGMSVIDLDRGRVKEFVSAFLAEAVAHSILHADAAGAGKLGREAAAQLHLREGEAENHTTRYITLSDGQAPDVFAEADGSFHARFKDLRGWRRAQMTGEAYRTAMNQAVPNVLVPRMRERAKDLRADVRKQWENQRKPWSKEMAGVSKAKAFLNGLLAEIRESARANSRKIEDISQTAAAVAIQVDECQQELEALARMSWLLRMLSSLSIWSTSRRYREAGAQAIRLELCLAACRVAQEDVFVPLQDYLLSELNQVQSLEGVLQETEVRSQARAAALLHAPPSILRTPTGLELVDRLFLKGFLKDQIQQAGLERLTRQTLDSILKVEGTLFRFLEGSADQVYESLTSCSLDLLRPSIDALDVMAAFRERYGDERLAPVVDRVLKESLPRIRTRGEVGKHIPIVKLVGVPAGADSAWLRGLLAQTDHTEGSWEIVELPSPCDAIVFASYRSSLSLTMIIEQHEAPPEGQTARERIEGAADPLLAIVPAGRMRVSDARVAAAYAEAAGLLRHDAKDGYCLRQADHRDRSLGPAVSEALASLQSSFDDVVHIYSAWGECLIEVGEAALGKLRDLRSNAGRSIEGNGSALHDATAVDRAMDETKELLELVGNLRRRRAAQR